MFAVELTSAPTTSGEAPRVRIAAVWKTAATAPKPMLHTAAAATVPTVAGNERPSARTPPPTTTRVTTVVCRGRTSRRAAAYAAPMRPSAPISSSAGPSAAVARPAARSSTDT